MNGLSLFPPTVHILQKERKSKIVILISLLVVQLDRILFLTKGTLQGTGLSLLFTTCHFLR